MSKARILGYNKQYIANNRRQEGAIKKKEYDTKEFRKTIQGKELANKYKQARFVGAEGPEFESFENFCKWAFENGYKPGMILHRGKGKKSTKQVRPISWRAKKRTSSTNISTAVTGYGNR